MLKKVAIAGLAVVVGVVLLAWISPTLYDYVRNEISNAQKNAEKSITPEKRIEILRNKLKELDNKKADLLQNYGDKKSDLKDAQKQLSDLQDGLKLAKARIDAFTDKLGDTQKTTFTFQGKDWSRKEVEDQLKMEWKNYTNAKDNSLPAKIELVNARQEATDAALEAVAKFDQQRDELAAKLDKMEAEVQQLRAKEAAAAARGSDNDLANLNAEAGDVEKQLDAKNSALDPAVGLKGGPIDPLATSNGDKDDILKEIRDYEAAHNPTPAPVVADKK